MTATRPTEPGVIAKPEEDTLIQEMHVVVERAAVLEVGATWSERQVVAHGDPALWEIDDNGSSAATTKEMFVRRAGKKRVG